MTPEFTQENTRIIYILEVKIYYRIIPIILTHPLLGMCTSLIDRLDGSSASTGWGAQSAWGLER